MTNSEREPQQSEQPEPAEAEERAEPKVEEETEEKIEVKKDIETPFERMTLELEDREIEKYQKELEITDETKETVGSFLKQEHEDRHNEFALQWFEYNKGELEGRGEPLDVSDERKIEIAARNGAFQELMKEERHKEKWEEIENISAIKVDLEKGKVSPDGLSLALNLLQKRVEETEKDLKKAEKKGDEQTVSLKKRELDGLFSARQELAEKVSGRDLRGEAEDRKEIKKWETEQSYLADKKEYIERNYERIRGERSRGLINKYKEEIEKRKDLTDAERKKEIKKIERKDYTHKLAEELLGFEIKKEKGLKGLIKSLSLTGKRFEIVGKDGRRVREPKDIFQVNEFLREKIKEKFEEESGEEWEAKKDKREAKIKELIGKEIKGLAESPEKAKEGIETVYSRLKERLITEFTEEGLRKEKKSREGLREIEQEFKGKGEDISEFVDNALHRRGDLEKLRGDWEEDEETIGGFLNEWGIPAESERVKAFLKTERGKEYKEIVGKRKGFLEWLIDLVFFLLTPPEKEKQKQGAESGAKRVKKKVKRNN